MKFIKLLVFILIILLIAGALYFATKDGTYQVEASQEMEVPNEVVYDIVNNYKTWEEWGPWKKQDPTMVFNYADQTSGEGASYNWQGAMDGAMKTTEAIPHTSLQQTLTLNTPGGERTSTVYWNFEPTENTTTKVTWGMTGEHSLMDKVYYAFSGMDFNGDMQTMLHTGLEGLATLAQNEINKYTITVDGITQYGGGFYLSRTTSAKQQAALQVMRQNYQGIQEFMKQNNIASSGMPFTIYNERYPNGDVIMTNAIPVREKIIVAGSNNVLSGYSPTVTAIKTTLKGNYSHLDQAWEKAMQHVSAKNYKFAEAKPFEVYVTKQEELPNPADWVTEIYLPIQDLD